MINLIYQNQKIKFPLIASVLEGNQQGQVLKNNETSPAHFFVINKFGFCQELFTEFDENFFEEIKQFILKRKYKKMRCYAPQERFKGFLDSIDFAQRAERTQFKFSSVSEKNDFTGTYRIENVNEQNIKLLNFGLHLTSRFWSDEVDFINNAHAVIAFDADQPIGICYSAANGLGKAEIDIFVEENYRKTGIGFELSVKFIKECLKRGITPSWDCYSNNTGSVNLAQKLGFKEKLKYDFYNIDGGN